jgi:2-polyprenyl-3-methyl-5-hydroxy-6-metoxy-1,4-benzoquinol methylase
MKRPRPSGVQLMPRLTNGQHRCRAEKTRDVGDQRHKSAEVTSARHASSPMAPVLCDLCGATEARLVMTCERLDGPLVQCRRCGLIYVGERREDFTLAHFDPERSRRLAERVRALGLVDEAVEAGEAPVRERVMAERLHWVQRFIASGQLLDVGCADGAFLELAARAGFQAHGVEPDPTTSAEAQKRTGVRVFSGTLADARYPAASFDVVVLFHVLEHLDSPRRTLQEIHRLLRPDGLIVIETPNIASFWFHLLGRRWRQFIPDHYYFFSPATLTRLLEENGFRVLALTHPRRVVSMRLLADRARRVCAPVGRILRWGIARLGWEEKTLALRLDDVMRVAARKT